MVTLRELRHEEYSEFECAMVRFYAEQSVQAGRVPREEALEWSRNETHRYLPQGPGTPGAYLWAIEKEGSGAVGYLWCGRDTDDRERLHLFDILVFEGFRNQGIGTRALELLEGEAERRGFRRIGLHVYAFNTAAIHVYRKLGYRETDLSMSKELQR